MIIVDTREPEKIVYELQRRGANIRVETLAVGDYLVGNILIERKTLSNFYTSLIIGELWSQLQALKEQELRTALCIINQPFQGLDDRKEKVIMSTVSSIITDWDMNVWVVPSEEFFVKLLISIDREVGFSQKGARPVKKGRSNTMDEELENLLCQVTGIGLKTAKLLLSKFKTLKSVVNASREELEELGIRKNVLEHFLKLVVKEYGVKEDKE